MIGQPYLSEALGVTGQPVRVVDDRGRLEDSPSVWSKVSLFNVPRDQLLLALREELMLQLGVQAGWLVNVIVDQDKFVYLVQFEQGLYFRCQESITFEAFEQQRYPKIFAKTLVGQVAVAYARTLADRFLGGASVVEDSDKEERTEPSPDVLGGGRGMKRRK